MRGEHQQRQRHFYGGSRCEMGEAVAARAVSHLVVGLQEVDESDRRQMRRRLAALPPAVIGRGLPLIAKAEHHGLGDAFGRRVGIVLIVAGIFAGQQRVHGLMPVVIPCGGE